MHEPSQGAGHRRPVRVAGPGTTPLRHCLDDIDSEAKLKIYDKGMIRIGEEPIFNEFHYRLRSGDIYSPRIDLTEPLRLQCAHFIDCIREQREPSAGLHVRPLPTPRLAEFAP